MADTVCLKISAPHDPSGNHPDGAEQFTAARLDDIRRIKETFDLVYPLTMDEWCDALKNNENPDKELAWWLSFSEVYRDYTEGMPPDVCKQAFIDLLGITINATTPGSIDD